MSIKLAAGLLTMTLSAGFAIPAAAQEILPFPPKPSGSTAGRTMQESIYSPLPSVSHLPKDAPNILIVLIDDVGPAQTDTYGGEIHTPTLSKIANEGISYNRFHTTAMCSPTRAALLTGRNPPPRRQRSDHGAGERLGRVTRAPSRRAAPRSPRYSRITATAPRPGASGTTRLPKQTTAAGPFDYWPTGYGFEYFYGFLAGEASQYEPQLVRNTAYVEHPRTSGGHDYYHLSEDLADDAIGWLREHKAFAPDKPFFMYWAQRRLARPASRPEGMGRQVQGQVRRRLGQVPRARLQARQADGLDSAERATDPAARHPGVLGLDPRGREAFPAPSDGGLRRLHRARGRTGRPHRRRDRSTRLRREHADPLHLGRQRRFG